MDKVQTELQKTWKCMTSQLKMEVTRGLKTVPASILRDGAETFS